MKYLVIYKKETCIPKKYGVGPLEGQYAYTSYSYNTEFQLFDDFKSAYEFAASSGGCVVKTVDAEVKEVSETPKNCSGRPISEYLGKRIA